MTTQTKIIQDNAIQMHDKQSTKETSNKLTVDEVIDSMSHNDDPDVIRRKVQKRINKDEYKNYTQHTDDESVKAFTLAEMKKGVLLSLGVKNEYKTFVVHFARKIMEDYKCENELEKSLAHNIALNYTRTLQTQQRITTYLNRDTVTDIGIKYLDFLSKELDRANRHYHTSLEKLLSMKQPQIEMFSMESRVSRVIEDIQKTNYDQFKSINPHDFGNPYDNRQHTTSTD